MWERIKRILIKEFLQINRDPRMKAVIFVMPVIQSLVFGYAVTTDLRHVPVAVYDTDRTPASRTMVEQFTGSGYFDVVDVIWTDETARDLVDRGDVKMVIRIRKGFGANIASGRPAPLQLIVDGSDSNTAAVILNYSNRIVSKEDVRLLVSRLERQGYRGPPAAVSLRSRAWFNSNLESRNFYIPGVVALLVTLVTLLLTSMAVVREKEIGTIEQIIVTPIRKGEFIIGKSVPFALIAFIDVFFVTLVATLWFHVPIRGSILLLLAATALFLMSTIGIGLLISTVSSTQQQAMMGTFFFFMPALLLSGFMFPIANMPEPIQWLTYLNPIRYFLVIVRGIFLKGTGVAVLWPQMAALGLLGVTMLTIASSRFRKTLA
ncbi:MAG: ABC transporter permease [Thermoanaerobaculia bacterium]